MLLFAAALRFLLQHAAFCCGMLQHAAPPPPPPNRLPLAAAEACYCMLLTVGAHLLTLVETLILLHCWSLHINRRF